MRAVTTLFAAVLACAPLLGATAAVAGAESPAAPAPAMCPAPKHALPSVEAFARLQARLEAEAAAAGGDAPIVLNGRGYNYGPGRDPLRELQILQAERARARAQR